MKIYVGQTRSRQLVKDLAAIGFGECTQPAELPPRRRPWFLDNGAYRAHVHGAPFDGAAFELALSERGAPPPDFIVVPDKVAAADSLAFSLAWLPRCRILRATSPAPLYLAVQDGMDPTFGGATWSQLIAFDGVFVGGSKEWKIKTGEAWVRLAHRMSRPCHIGRAGGVRRAAWAKRIGADSLDSSLPLWSADNLRRFLLALSSRQTEIVQPD